MTQIPPHFVPVKSQLLQTRRNKEGGGVKPPIYLKRDIKLHSHLEKGIFTNLSPTFSRGQKIIKIC